MGRFGIECTTQVESMRIPFFSRLMEIKETQLAIEYEENNLLRSILEELKGGAKNGKHKNKRTN